MKTISILFSLCVLILFTGCNDEPLEDDFPDESTLNCETTSQNVVTAATNFLEATSENYTELCNAYRAALQAQISACGDSVGAIQQVIDSLGDCSEDINTCEAATTAADEAGFAFNSATSDTYEALCMAYRAALENQIVACGDANGSIQNTIDGLGDCTEPVVDIEISVTAGTLDLEFDMVTVVEEGTILQITGTSTSTPYMIYFEVEDLITGDDVLENFVLTLTSEFFPSDMGFDPFTSNIAVNSQGLLQGTFSGLVTNADNADLNLTSGVIDISY